MQMRRLEVLNEDGNLSSAVLGASGVVLDAVTRVCYLVPSSVTASPGNLLPRGISARDGDWAAAASWGLVSRVQGRRGPGYMGIR